MNVLPTKILTSLISTVSLRWQWNIIALMILDSLWKSSIGSWNLTRNISHCLMVLILAICVLINHLILPFTLIWMVCSLLLRWSYSWNRFYISSTIAIVLSINWWHSMRHCLIVLIVMRHLRILIALIALLSILLSLFEFTSLSHLVINLWWTFLIILLRIVDIRIVFLHLFWRYRVWFKNTIVFSNI